ncbi:MAG TPA: hypothetical protein VN455_11140 [Methanotrichaceae archaeon]|nr:hypothetical protein [Methanotrichaceae archaeon]
MASRITSEIKKPAFLYTGFPARDTDKGPEITIAAYTAERDIVQVRKIALKKMALFSSWHDLANRVEHYIGRWLISRSARSSGHGHGCSPWQLHWNARGRGHLRLHPCS